MTKELESITFLAIFVWLSLNSILIVWVMIEIGLFSEIKLTIQEFYKTSFRRRK